MGCFLRREKGLMTIIGGLVSTYPMPQQLSSYRLRVHEFPISSREAVDVTVVSLKDVWGKGERAGG